MKKIMLISLFLLLSLSLIACGSNRNEVVEVNNVVDYEELIEESLYYINNIDFATRYDAFLNKNSHLEVIDIESVPRTSTYNSTKGYYIFTKEIMKIKE